MVGMDLIERTLAELSTTVPPGVSEIHVWRFPLDPPARDVLNDAERARAARFAIEQPRTQFRAARTALRCVLGSYLQIDPREVELDIEPDGKPILANRDLDFNVTHSGKRGLIAVAQRRIGIDIEQLRPMPNADGLVERFFGPEERQQFGSLPAEMKLAGFFRGWTGKEALLKAVGTGIQNVDQCVVDLDPRQAPAVVRFDRLAEFGEWRLHAWEPEPGYVAAVAIESTTPVTSRK